MSVLLDLPGVLQTQAREALRPAARVRASVQPEANPGHRGPWLQGLAVYQPDRSSARVDDRESRSAIPEAAGFGVAARARALQRHTTAQARVVALPAHPVPRSQRPRQAP